MGSFSFPGPPGSTGGSKAGFGALNVEQSWNSQENAVVVNGYKFQITDAGRRLSFPDATYDLNETPQTIVIGKDGKTRKQAGP